MNELVGAVTDFAEDHRTGLTRAVDTINDCFDRIERNNAQLNAFVSYDRDRCLEAAESVDARAAAGRPVGKLAGVPIAIKDNICTKAGTTTCGSRILGGFRSPYDAHVIERLLAEDAIVVGKTNMDEFGMGSSTENSAHGPVRNPWNPQCVAGGSSGGSAAAVADRLVACALGSDTGGSIRQPASFCGVMGIKPTYGRVSRYGLVAYGSSLDQIGAITQDARDAALLMSIISGHDSRDSTSLETDVPDYVSEFPADVRGWRIGISEEYFSEGLDPEVEKNVLGVLDEFTLLGAKVVPIKLPHTKYATACYYIIATAEASSNLARFDGVRYGYRSNPVGEINQLYGNSRGDGFGDEVKRRIMLGTFSLSSGYYDAYYDKAMRVRTLIRGDFDEAFKQADVIVSPVAPTTAFKIGEKTADPLSMYLSDIYTISVNLAGICAVSVPCGFSQGGLPVGAQIMGPALGESKILGAAHLFQQHSEYHRASPGDTNAT
ncbi:MAG: Asp-tRNA(Asn)/Glu-tRNA(Gln) amidotransferase subunit GatA [Planctomycetota bacterium]